MAPRLGYQLRTRTGCGVRSGTFVVVVVVLPLSLSRLGW